MSRYFIIGLLKPPSDVLASVSVTKPNFPLDESELLDKESRQRGTERQLSYRAVCYLREQS